MKAIILIIALDLNYGFIMIDWYPSTFFFLVLLFYFQYLLFPTS